MSVVFIWKKQYAVGVPELDKQHQDIFNLGNKLQRVNPDESKPYVMELYKYARAHFKTEESHMKQINYPDLNHHRKLHDKFIADLNLISKDFTDDSLDKLRSFLYSWLIDHVLNEDNRYFLFSNCQEGA